MSSILLASTTALEVLRSPEYLTLADEWGESGRTIPDAMPSREDLRREIEGHPLLDRLTKPLHLLVSTDDTASSWELACRHVSRVDHPHGSFVRIGDRIWVTSPEEVVLQMAGACTPLELSLLMDELLGTYALVPAEPLGMVQRERPLTTLRALERHLYNAGSGYGTRKVRGALPLAFQGSNSPMESKLALRVSAPMALGGYETPFVSMNEEVILRPIGDEFDKRRIRKPDIVFLNRRPQQYLKELSFIGVVLDYNGIEHLTPERAAADDDRRNELLGHGLKPYGVNKVQYDRIDSMDFLMSAILRDIGEDPGRIADGRDARIALHDELERYDCIHWSLGRTRHRVATL